MDDLRLALLLNAVSPALGGLLVRGEKGTAKSTAVRGLADLLAPVEVVRGCRFACAPAAPDPRCPDGPHPPASPPGADPTSTSSASTSPVAVSVVRPVRLVELPVGASEDRVTGSLDLDRALADGVSVLRPGLLAAAHRGILYVDEVNLLGDHLVDVLLDAAATGVAHVERDGVSARHPARFVLVGTMNPEEGELRPQLLDRFALTVTVAASRDPRLRAKVVRRRLAYDADPAGFVAAWAPAQARLAARVAAATVRLPAVTLTDAALDAIAAICAGLDVDGMRADVVLARTALALAAWSGRDTVRAADLRTGARLALPHRRRRGPFDAPDLDDATLAAVLADALAGLDDAVAAETAAREQAEARRQAGASSNAATARHPDTGNSPEDPDGSEGPGGNDDGDHDEDGPDGPGGSGGSGGPGGSGQGPGDGSAEPGGMTDTGDPDTGDPRATTPYDLDNPYDLDPDGDLLTPDDHDLDTARDAARPGDSAQPGDPELAAAGADADAPTVDTLADDPRAAAPSGAHPPGAGRPAFPPRPTGPTLAPPGQRGRHGAATSTGGDGGVGLPGRATATGTAAAPGALFRPRTLTVGGLGATSSASGRRSPARTTRGAVVATSATAPGLHLPATLLAAAPHQHARGRRTPPSTPDLTPDVTPGSVPGALPEASRGGGQGGGRALRLVPSDRRGAHRVAREGNLVLFCVDASGSMAARARMTLVTTAVLALLVDAYQRRDRIGLITFRGAGAEVVLAPTSSVEAGAARLHALPTGGRTPLAAGLLRAGQVLTAERRRDPSRRALLVVVTDGRATAGGDPLPVARALRRSAPTALAASATSGAHGGGGGRGTAAGGLASVVVDCETGMIRLGLAARLADALGARTIPLDALPLLHPPAPPTRPAAPAAAARLAAPAPPAPRAVRVEIKEPSR
ncbi:VWA domain-containing protein [Frankia sp. Ag45/Mut15]|uniref:Mg-protoporphyrin IX chelatase n=1 Tax=Frankia umida TaxID=573489 RepID=A0ABT0K0H3_9ACTN|nr:VWA domain-containing protein [Frankia umida]MCK9877292.1 VWA domain-containing protein [Frankia umida]